MRKIKNIVEYVQASKLKNLENNPRKITGEQFETLKTSIQANPDYFEARPILCNTDYVVFAGNQRLTAAKQLGIKEVPVIVMDISHERQRELTIRDNVSNGIFDYEILANQWDAHDLLKWGLELPETTNVLPANDGSEIDYDVNSNIETNVKPGDLIQLGKHRLLCGDSTNPGHVSGLFDGIQPILMVTDPPYGVDYDPNWRNERKTIKKANRANMEVANDNNSNWGEAFKISGCQVIYVWTGGIGSAEFYMNLVNAGYTIVSQIIWNKNNIVLGRGDYHFKHEVCWYAIMNGKNHNWQGGRKQNTVWDIDKNQKNETGHSTQKPIECMARPIQNNSKPGEVIYDPFVGSGTTIIAAETLNRTCFAIEINPKICQMVIDRFINNFPAIEILINGKPYENE